MRMYQWSCIQDHPSKTESREEQGKLMQTVLVSGDFCPDLLHECMPQSKRHRGNLLFSVLCSSFTMHMYRDNLSLHIVCFYCLKMLYVFGVQLIC